MTSNFVTVTGLRRATPAEYQAQWNGRPLRIKLDMGATLRLMGRTDSLDRGYILSGKSELVAGVAQRLIDMRLEKPDNDDAIVMISALDLDATSLAQESFTGPEERSELPRAQAG